ncbi:MAG: class I SAM-dependent rRNA methyltransferase [Anaerolineae bacterium]|nr:class I SAM-dependent rRNA methyltransferase [Thermoflexales bacterium]MDW8408446.1 class I SAM-dependent rRNA methyltransferase [Anaerolineae bacterium]
MQRTPSSYPIVTLKSGRDKSVRGRHPRLFSGSIKSIDGRPKDGDVVDVCANSGEWLARGIINQQAQIAVRLLTWDEHERIDEAFWYKRVAQAVERRARDPLLAGVNARRLIFGESDGLPGVIVDDYAGCLVLQISTLAALQAKSVLLDALVQLIAPYCVLERSDDERLKYERVTPSRGLLYGELPSGPVEIVEHGLRFKVDPQGGQKTGFYLDQRDNRARVARYCAGAEVLNVFSYTAAFGVYAAARGARSVVNVDSSQEALRLAELNMALQPPSACATCYELADAFDFLRTCYGQGRQYDVVILDPPKFAHSPAQIERAARAYKDLNRVGFSATRAGGILATFSCSGVIDAALFQKIVFSAAIESGRDAQVVERLTQASDHPVLLSFPESEYLKGLICRVL